MGDPEDRVSTRAYDIWEAEGRPEGRDLDHWLQAERESAGEIPPVDGPVDSDALSPVDAPVEQNSAEAGVEHVIERDEETDPAVPASATLTDAD